jgi:hypothetical protein
LRFRWTAIADRIREAASRDRDRTRPLSHRDEEIDHDRIVVIEVMVEKLDRSWWGTYRAELELRFEQDQIVVRATEIERL